MNRPTRSTNRTAGTGMRGFTLVEMAVVVVLMALLVGSILVPLGTQVEQRRLAEAQRTLGDIREALIGYALAQTSAHLPCPDTDNDGIENRIAGSGACVAVEGNLPWVTLGVPSVDPWGWRYRYRVTAAFAQGPPGATFGLATTGDLQVCSATPATPPNCAAGQALTVVPPTLNSPVALVLSHGANGLGAVNPATGAQNFPAGRPLGADEADNADAANGRFVDRAPRPAEAAGGEYDDVVMWLSPHVLKTRAVAAGKLP